MRGCKKKKKKIPKNNTIHLFEQLRNMTVLLLDTFLLKGIEDIVSGGNSFRKSYRSSSSFAFLLVMVVLFLVHGADDSAAPPHRCLFSAC